MTTVRAMVGETTTGRRWHAVTGPGRQYARALCGVHVVVYSSKDFDRQPNQCGRCAQLLARARQPTGGSTL